MVQRTLKETKTTTVNRIQNDRDLLRSLRFALKKHLPVVKFADEKVVCTPSQLFMVTAQAQFSFKVKEQSTGKESSIDSQGEWPCLGTEGQSSEITQAFTIWFLRTQTIKSSQKKGSGGAGEQRVPEESAVCPGSLEGKTTPWGQTQHRQPGKEAILLLPSAQEGPLQGEMGH